MVRNPGHAIEGFAEFQDSHLYEVACPEGHLSLVVLQEQKFEILFEIGAYAIKDGYYREAFSSFVASLERFQEYFIRAYFKQLRRPEEDIEAMWRPMSAQSERQLGAYIVAYTNATGQPPRLLSNNDVKERNAVIHKGKIPTKQEAIAFGETCLTILRLGIVAAKETVPVGMAEMMHDHLRRGHEQAAGRRVATMRMATLVSLVDQVPEDQRTVEEYIQTLAMRPIWR